jgi:hypothetical protein
MRFSLTSPEEQVDHTLHPEPKSLSLHVKSLHHINQVSKFEVHFREMDMQKGNTAGAAPHVSTSRVLIFAYHAYWCDPDDIKSYY